jgi:hypothetical protein
MIHGPERLSIAVNVDDSVVDANASVSLADLRHFESASF